MQKVTCLLSKEDEKWLCYKKLGHLNLKYISNPPKKNLVRWFPNFFWKTHLLSKAYQKRKLLKSCLNLKIVFDPMRTLSLLERNMVGSLLMYSRYIWIFFIAHMSLSRVKATFNVFDTSNQWFFIKEDWKLRCVLDVCLVFWFVCIWFLFT